MSRFGSGAGSVIAARRAALRAVTGGRGAVLVAVVALIASLLTVVGSSAPVSAADPAGTITVMARGISSPLDVVAGPDGNLWFTNNGNNSIGRITPAGVVSDYSGTGIDQPDEITVGPDGNLWFTNYGNNSIGRITPAGVVSNYTGTGISSPRGITAGPDGNLWFAVARQLHGTT